MTPLSSARRLNRAQHRVARLSRRAHRRAAIGLNTARCARAPVLSSDAQYLFVVSMLSPACIVIGVTNIEK